MKRTVVAAAACLVASVACAQSSVTLFGVVDAAVTYTTGSGPAYTSRWQLTNSANSFSRLGFRGNEDLGGGLSAGFWLEEGLQNDTGTGFATNTNNQLNGTVGAGTLTFNRRSTVSLTSSTWGELRLGRDYTPTFWNTAIFDPFGTGGGIGANQLYFSGLGGLAAPTGTRASNSVGYFLPANLGGFYGSVMYAAGENVSNSTLPPATPGALPVSNKNDGNYGGVRLGYASGPVHVSIATGLTTYATGYLRVSNLGASWTFEQLMGLRIMGEYYVESLGAVDGRGGLLGFSLPVGAGEIKASYARYVRDPVGNVPNPTSSKLALGYVYNFSRRTAVYATVARLTNSNGASQALGGVSTSPNHASTGGESGMRVVF